MRAAQALCFVLDSPSASAQFRTPQEYWSRQRQRLDVFRTRIRAADFPPLLLLFFEDERGWLTEPEVVFLYSFAKTCALSVQQAFVQLGLTPQSLGSVFAIRVPRVLLSSPEVSETAAQIQVRFRMTDRSRCG